MAKIIAEFDTVTKELSVKMNDKRMGDVSSVYFMADWEDKKKGYVEITSIQVNEDEGTSRVERIMANEEEFSVVNDVTQEMAELMMQKRNRGR